MRILNKVLGAVLCASFVSACESVEKEADNTADILVSIDTMGGATRTSLSGYAPSWTDGDRIKVFDKAGKSATYLFKSPAASDGTAWFQCASADKGFIIGDFAAAYYPAANATSYTDATKTINVTIPATQDYTSGSFANGSAPMVSDSRSLAGDGTSRIYFSNAFCVVKLQLYAEEGASVSSITLTSFSDSYKLSGSASLQFTGTEANIVNASGSGSTSVTLNVSPAVSVGSSASPTVFYIPIPAPAVGASPAVQVDVEAGDDDISKTFQLNTTNKMGKNYARQNYIVSLPAQGIGPEPDPHILKGPFSVSDTKTVKFTKGNLYWDGSEYQFEEHQYDYPSTWNAGHVGHFYWSSTTDYTSETSKTAGMEPYAATYNYSTQTQTDTFCFSEANPLTVGSTTNLYVLTFDEWSYLTSSNSKRNNKSSYPVTVCGVTCVVLAPDDYEGTIASSYNETEWAAAESNYGFVCLPAADHRSGSTIGNGGMYNNLAQYWSATPVFREYPPYSLDSAHCLYWYTSPMLANPEWGTSKRSYGNSIRLVVNP